MYANGEIDEVFLNNSFSSDSDQESPSSNKLYSINTGTDASISPIQKRKRSKASVIHTKRNSFKLAVDDSESSHSEDESDKKTINLQPGNLRFTTLDN